jgi:hypothetical protein
VLPEGCEVGLNPEDDLAHGYHVTDSDVTVVAAG